MSAALVKKHNGNKDAVAADVGVQLVKGEADKLERRRVNANRKLAAMQKEYRELEAELKPGGKFRIDNLVGGFGPEKLARQPWYKSLFG